MSRVVSHVVLKPERKAADISCNADEEINYNKVRAFDSDKMYARNEARRQSCSDAFRSRGSQDESNSVTTWNRKPSLAINRHVFELILKFNNLTSIPLVKLKSN
jgi:hypothetical protein